MKASTRALLVVVAGGASIGCAPSYVDGQTPAGLGTACMTAGGDSAVCRATSVAAQALLGHLAAVAGLGSEVPGTASNLGRRLGTTPRVALSLRAGGLRAGLPDLGDPTGLDQTSFFVPTLHAGPTLGRS